MNRLKFARGVFIFLLVAVTYLTLTADPDDTAPEMAVARWVAAFLFHNESLADKVAHFSAYAALGASAVFAAAHPFGRTWLTPVLLAAYGALLEGAQGLGGVRSPELADALSNAAGAVSGFVAATLLVRLRSKDRSK